MSRSSCCVKSVGGARFQPRVQELLPTNGNRLCILHESYGSCRAAGRGEPELNFSTYAIGVMSDPPMPAIDAKGRNGSKSKATLEHFTIKSVSPVAANQLVSRMAQGRGNALTLAQPLRALQALLILAFAYSASPAMATAGVGADEIVWRVWQLALDFVCFALRIVAVPAGVGASMMRLR
jgi:hypothetical protein